MAILLGKKNIIEWLRQRSRPYLFSNTLAPSITAASIKALDIIENDLTLKAQLESNSLYFREHMHSLGFNLIPGNHPIIPIMLGEAKITAEIAANMLKECIYIVGFSYPVVPEGKARIRVQLSASHSKKDLNRALEAFEKMEKG